MQLQHLQELLCHNNGSDVMSVFYTHHQLMGLQSELFWGLLSNQSDVVLQEAHDSDSFFDKFIKYRTEGS